MFEIKKEDMSSLLPFDIRVLDIFDILLVAVLIYQLYNLIKGTNAINIFIGIISFYLVWKIVDFYEMELLSEIMGQFISVGIIALIIVFQQEIRQFLLLMGTPNFLKKGPLKNLFNKWKINKSFLMDIDSIIEACVNMSKEKTGALIVVTNNNKLEAIIDSGIVINSKINSQLLESIFYKNSPLHDGAVIISGNKIIACRCILPTTNSASFPLHLGLRHRSGVGITEISDSISIMVSEQTGSISIAINGQITTKIDKEKLKTILKRK